MSDLLDKLPDHIETCRTLDDVEPGCVVMERNGEVVEKWFVSVARAVEYAQEIALEQHFGNAAYMGITRAIVKRGAGTSVN